MRNPARLLLGLAAIGVAVSGGTFIAHAGQQTPTDNQPSVVEDFAYPGADALQANYGITLVSGDGHILFADCTTPPTGNIGLIQVHCTDPVGANQAGTVCFKVTSASGQLSLKILTCTRSEVMARSPAPATSSRRT